MDFAAPEWVFGGLLIGTPLLLFFFWATRLLTRRARGVFCEPSLWPRLLTGADWRPGLRILAFGLAVAGILTALARPLGESNYEEVASQGVNIVVALDVSSSMRATDFQPGNRLEAARIVLSSFIGRVPGDRVGLILFAGSSFMQCPLTLDHDTLLMMLQHTDFTSVEKDGTAIGEAIRTAVRAFEKEENRAPVLLLLTDGENNHGVDPMAAAREAAKAGIKIYTVGIGTPGGSKIPESQDFFGRPVYKTYQGREVVTSLDENLLRQIAVATGGEYTFADSTQAMARAADKIQTLQKTTLKSRRRAHASELYPYFTLAALFLLVLECVFAGSSLPRWGRMRLFSGRAGNTTLLVLAFFFTTGMGLPARWRLQQGNNLYQKDDYPGAQEKYEQAVEAGPNQPESYYNLGNAYYRQEMFDKAAENYQKAVVARPDLSQGYYNLGNASYKQGQWQAAVDAYEQALRLNPDDTNTQFNLEAARKKLKQNGPGKSKPQNQGKQSGRGSNGKQKQGETNQSRSGGAQAPPDRDRMGPKAPSRPMTGEEMKRLQDFVKQQSQQYSGAFNPTRRRPQNQGDNPMVTTAEQEIDRMRQMMGLPPLFGGAARKPQGSKARGGEEKDW